MRFLVDENLNNHIFRSLLLQRPGLDIVRIQDIGMSGQPDEMVLSYALSENRIVLTHDVRTFPALAIQWINQGLEIPGIFLIDQSSPMGVIIGDLLLITDASEPKEWEGMMHYLPL